MRNERHYVADTGAIEIVIVIIIIIIYIFINFSLHRLYYYFI